MKGFRWPWRPREYVVTIAALHEAEAALARRQAEASKLRAAQGNVRRELTRRRRDQK